MLASGPYPWWFLDWYLLWNSAPYWPGLVLSCIWAFTANRHDERSLRRRLKALAVFWLLSIGVHVAIWQVFVMDW